MKVRFTKEWTGPYGTFVLGRTVELPPTTLAAAPKDCYVAVLPEAVKETSEAKDGKETTKDKKQNTKKASPAKAPQD